MHKVWDLKESIGLEIMSMEDDTPYLPKTLTAGKTIEILTRHRDAPPGPTVSMSTTNNNATEPASGPSTHVSLLWLPYVLIVLVFMVFLGANFWCYHKKHRERYLRKRDEKRVKEGLHERRRITALMRSHFQSAFMSQSKSVDSQAGETEDIYVDPKTEITEVTEVSSSIDHVISPFTDQWTSQNGTCKANDVCNMNSQTMRTSSSH